MLRYRKHPKKAFAAGVVLWLLISPPASTADTVSLPGGTAAVARLFGVLDRSPEGLLLSLNRVFLVSINSKHEWKEVAGRASFVEYLGDMRELQKKFSSALVVGARSKTARKNFIRLAGELGYKAKLRGEEFQLTPKEGQDAERRRRLAFALDLNLNLLAQSLRGGVEERVRIGSNQVELPLDSAKWGELSGKPPPPEKALEAFAKDQRLGLILEGERRLSHETETMFGRIGMRWFYDNAPRAFYRYAAAVEFSDGKLRVPGGEAARLRWEELTGQSLAETKGFLQELFSRKSGRVAYFWQAMHFVPPTVSRFYLGTGSGLSRESRKYVKRLFSRLDNATTSDFDGPRGGDLGFPVFVRSIPLSADGSQLALPGGPGLWFGAIKGDQMPPTSEALAKAVRKAQARRMDDGEFLAKVLTEKVDKGRYKIPVLPRLIRAVHILGGRDHLLTPQNVILLTRAVDSYPPALAIIDSLDFEDPKVIEQYLLAVRKLDSLQEGTDRELLVTNFQSGVECIRVMALAGKVPHRVLEDYLGRWAKIHLRHDTAGAAVSAQVRWLLSLLEALPKVPEDRPGRGPLERSLLDALVGYGDQEFRWKGLNYQGKRGLDLATAMARNLVRQDIPSADHLVEVVTRLARLQDLCKSADLPAAQAEAQALVASIRSLPTLTFEPPLKDKLMLSRITNVHRADMLAVVQKVTVQKKAKKLPRMVERLGDVEPYLAREVRPFLLAPAYLAAMGDQDHPLFQASGLIHRHILVEKAGTSFARDRAWSSAVLVKSDLEQVGSQILGSVHAVSAAVSVFSLDTTGGASDSAFSGMTRARAWYSDLVNTRWQALDPAITRLLALCVKTGEQILENASQQLLQGGGAAFDFAWARIPRARLERAAHGVAEARKVAVSEVFILGLAAVAGDAYGPAEEDLISPDLLSSIRTVQNDLGTEWRALLNRAGAATPNLNGKSRPWVGTWPSFEAIERESMTLALMERELLDLRIALLAYLGRNSLPGVVGADLMRRILNEIGAELGLESAWDWEGWIRWTEKLDDAYFDAKIRECLKDGLYRLQSF